MSSFPSTHCFWATVDAYPSRYLRVVCAVRTDKWHEWRVMAVA